MIHNLPAGWKAATKRREQKAENRRSGGVAAGIARISE
jgi:hypothetical protein